MKRRLLVCSAVLITFIGLAQDSDFPKYENDTLFLQNGLKYYSGMRVKMGKGSMPDGDFKYIRRNASSVFQYNSTTGHQGLANQANALPRRCAGYEYKIVKIEKRGGKKIGYQYYPIMNSGTLRFEIDLQNAIDAGELVVPEGFKKSSSAAAPGSLADELKKLKELMDAGAISQEEYDAAKKKLLQ
jgi:hypothetical protein